jgi:hypothetical protein
LAAALYAGSGEMIGRAGPEGSGRLLAAMGLEQPALS